MKLILTFSGVLIFVPGCRRWSHTAHAVRINIAYPTVLLFYQARDRSHLPSAKESLLSLHSLSAPGSSLRWHITEPMKVLLCQKRLLLHSAPLPWDWSHPYYTDFRDAILQAAVSIGTALSPYDSCYTKRLLPHSTSLPPAMRLATSAFRGFPWCNPLIPLSSLSELTAISNGTALSPQDSCCANKDCFPTVLPFHQPGDWPYQHSAAFRDAILQAAVSIGTALSPYDSCYAKKILLPHSTSLPPARRLAISAFRSLPWCNPPGSNLHWHSAEPIWLMLCQKRLLPHSTSLPPAMRLATSAFRSFPWCDPLIPLSSLSEPAAISNGTALSPQDSCCANKDCSPTVLLSHQPGDWPYQHSAGFRDAILLFLSPPSQNRQQSPLAQHWANRTHAVPTKIAPAQYFSSTSQETGHISILQPLWCNPLIPLSISCCTTFDNSQWCLP